MPYGRTSFMASLNSKKLPTITEQLAARTDSIKTSGVVDFMTLKLVKALSELGPRRSDYAEVPQSVGAYMAAIDTFRPLECALMETPELGPLRRKLERAKASYLPSGESKSPIAASYLNCWCLFDAAVGEAHETLAAIGIGLLRCTPAWGASLELLSKLERSRMGLYVVEEPGVETVILREVGTTRRLRCVNPSGAGGSYHCVWFVRVLPPPAPEFGFEEHVIFTTPYEIQAPREAGWLQYLERALPKTGNREESYYRLLKHGPWDCYWHEYILNGFVRRQRKTIQLMGLPDVEASLPNSGRNADEDQEALYGYMDSGKMLTGKLE